ncbi:MAG: hypothetical protein GX579_18690, partial [Chloroflexi bacterium]|nr:hypothetical protein [Chloroflexota bacterium]
AAELYFPEPVPAARELEGAARGAQSAADEALALALAAQEQASTLRWLGIGALVLAVAALALNAVTLRRAR